MSKQFASIYFLPQEGYFVLAIAITDKGLPMETYLIRLVPSDAASDQLWAAVEEALRRFGQRLPHEESLQISNGWRKEHGFNSWRHFAKNAIDCSIAKTDKGYTFRKGEWDGRGFGPAEGGKLEFPLNTPAEQLGTALIPLMRGASPEMGEKSQSRSFKDSLN